MISKHAPDTQLLRVRAVNRSPFVSVVVTAYNSADTIGRAIGSVIVQTVDDLEIVVVDDASTDETASVVEALENPKIRLVRNAVNRGIGGAKNVGVLSTRGRYVAFLDSDDEWLPNKLCEQLSAITGRSGDEERPPLSFHEAWVHRRDTGKAILRRKRKRGSWLRSILMGETLNFGSTLLARRELFDEIGPLDEGLTRLQDRDWTLRYLDRYEDFLYLTQPLARIYNRGWPDAGTVAKSVDALYRANEPRLAGRNPRNARLFRAGLDFEVAAAVYRDGRRFAALAMLTGLMARAPNLAGYIVGRGVHKIRNFDFD